MKILSPNDMTIEERKRTCSYCLKLFSTKEKFNDHWMGCPSRIKNGYFYTRGSTRK